MSVFQTKTSPISKSPRDGFLENTDCVQASEIPTRTNIRSYSIRLFLVGGGDRRRGWDRRQNEELWGGGEGESQSAVGRDAKFS